MVCPNTLCSFRGVSELQHSFLEESHLHTFSLLLSTSEARGGGRNSPSTAFWGTQSSSSCKRRERGCLACPHADTQSWLRKDVSGVWKRSRNMYFPNKLKTSINVFPQLDVTEESGDHCWSQPLREEKVKSQSKCNKCLDNKGI